MQTVEFTEAEKNLMLAARKNKTYCRRELAKLISKSVSSVAGYITSIRNKMNIKPGTTDEYILYCGWEYFRIDEEKYIDEVIKSEPVFEQKWQDFIDTIKQAPTDGVIMLECIDKIFNSAGRKRTREQHTTAVMIAEKLLHAVVNHRSLP